MLTVNLAARFFSNAILMHFNYRNFFLSMLWKILNSLKTNWNCNQNYWIFAQTLSMLLSRLSIFFFSAPISSRVESRPWIYRPQKCGNDCRCCVFISAAADWEYLWAVRNKPASRINAFGFGWALSSRAYSVAIQNMTRLCRMCYLAGFLNVISMYTHIRDRV